MKLNRVQYKSFSGLFDDSEEERLFAKFPGRKAAMISRRSRGSNFRSTNRTLNKPTGGGTKPPVQPVSPVQPVAQQNPTYTLTGGSGNGSSTYYIGGTSTSTSAGGTGTKPPAGGGGYAASAGLGNNGGITGGPASDFAAAQGAAKTGSGQGGYAAMAGQGKSPITGSGPASDFVAATSQGSTGGGGVSPDYRYTSTTSTAGSGLNYANAPTTPNGGRKSLRDITAKNQQQQSPVQPQVNGGQSTANPAAGKQRRLMTNERKRVARQSYDAGYQKGMNSANEQISQMQSQLDAANNAVTAAQNSTGVSQGLQNTWNNGGFMTKAGMLGATGAGLYFLGKGVMDTVDGNGQDQSRY